MAFKDIVNITDMDSPYQDAGASYTDKTTQSTARRLRRTRQHLGSYRHDLLVAMRVVNNVEGEMMRAEWENWLLDENTRCKQVQMMLRESETSVVSTKKSKSTEGQRLLEKEKEKEKKARMESLRMWQEEYCTSCIHDQELLREGRKHVGL
jgi:hypothetical protein